MHYKYAQRNVRGLALLITAQEREQIQTNGNIQIDVAKSQEMSEEDASSSNSESNSDDEEPTEDPIDAKPSNDDGIEEVNEASTSKDDESKILVKLYQLYILWILTWYLKTTIQGIFSMQAF